VIEAALAGMVGAVVGSTLPGVAARVPNGRAVLAWARWMPGAVADRRGGTAMGSAVLFAAVTALVFLALGLRFGIRADLPAFLYLGALGVVLGAIDLAHHRLPNALVLPSYPVGLALLGVAAAARGDGDAYVRALAGTAILYSGYLLLALAHPAGLGFGDVKLAGLLGLYLGWLGWDVLAVGAVLGVFAGGLTGLLLLLTGRATRRSAIAFGPAMLAGAFAAVLWGHQIADWYLGKR
jgi:leader peptidase (prepilin peptidase)/N-methyltransferase